MLGEDLRERGAVLRVVRSERHDGRRSLSGLPDAAPSGRSPARAVAPARSMTRVVIGAGAIDLVDEDQRRDAEPLQGAEQERRLRLDALDGGDDEDRAVEHAEDAFDLGDEVGVARRVDQVDREVADEERGDGGPDRDAAFALELERVGLGGAGVDAADVIDGACGVEEPFAEGGLTGVDVGEDSEIERAHGASCLPRRYDLLAGHGCSHVAPLVRIPRLRLFHQVGMPGQARLKRRLPWAPDEETSMREPGQPVLDEVVQAALHVDGIQSAALFVVAPPSTSLELAAAAGIAGPPLDGSSPPCATRRTRSPARSRTRARRSTSSPWRPVALGSGATSRSRSIATAGARPSACSPSRTTHRWTTVATNRAHRPRGDGRGGDPIDNLDLERLKRLTCDASVSSR